MTLEQKFDKAVKIFNIMKIQKFAEGYYIQLGSSDSNNSRKPKRSLNIRKNLSFISIGLPSATDTVEEYLNALIASIDKYQLTEENIGEKDISNA